jgi:hypothetical protein
MLHDGAVCPRPTIRPGHAPIFAGALLRQEKEDLVMEILTLYQIKDYF